MRFLCRSALRKAGTAGGWLSEYRLSANQDEDWSKYLRFFNDGFKD
jgi:hypothetical protein